MQQYGILPNVRLYSAAINACARAGRLEEAIAVFQHSQKAGIRYFFIETKKTNFFF